jgi:hypothetical protein
MDVWVSTCRRRIESCSYCHKPIDSGSIVVYGKLWMRNSKDKDKITHWVRHFYWHTDSPDNHKCCWLEQGIENAKKMQSQYIENRGGKRLLLPEEDRKKRLQILQRRARLVQMLKDELEKQVDGDKNLDKIIEIGNKIEQLKQSIELYGGAPKSWNTDDVELQASVIDE